VDPCEPVERFFRACNEADVEALEACVHPDFEMVVPQRPSRNFTGRRREVDNLKFLFDTYPDLSISVLRRAVEGYEVWTETHAAATGLEMAAVVIWSVDEETGTLRRARYYSEPVETDGPAIDEFIRGLGRPG
jgi:ketosteroid isomerase-like protein